MSMIETAKKVMNKNPEGCSMNPHTGTKVLPATGYIVALTDNEMTAEDETEIIKIGTLAAVMNISSYFLGYWKDERTGKRFLDLSVHIKDLNVALEIANLHNQKAIFCCADCNCIYLPTEAAAA